MASNSNPAGLEFQVNPPAVAGEQSATSRSIAVSPTGEFVVTWTSLDQTGSGDNLFAQRYSAAGVALGIPIPVNTSTAGDQRNSRVAIDALGNFVVVWEDANPTDDGTIVYARRFDAAGLPLSGEIPLNAAGNFSQRRFANVALAENGDFVATWTSRGQDFDSTNGVYARRYDAATSTLGNEFLVNSTIDNNQQDSSVTIAPDGSYVIAWTSEGQSDGNLGDVYFQKFGAAGDRIGGETRVNTYVINNQQDVNIASDASGNFVVTWSSINQNGQGSEWDIYARRYDAAGVAQGDEFRVNGSTAGTQRYSTVAMAATGDFIVSWAGTNAGSDDVYARRYSATGVVQGDEFRVNTTTFGNQKNPAIALDADGDAVIVWTSPDASGTGVFGQLLKSSELPSTSGIANILLPKNALDQVVNLWAAFSDVETADPNLNYAVFSNNNPSLFAAGSPSFNPATGELTLDFAADAVGSGDLIIRVTDEDGLYVDTGFNVTLFPVDDPPSVTLTGGSIAYTEGDPAIVVAPLILLADDNSQISSATVRITNFSAGDRLNFTAQNNIDGIYSSSTGILSLTGAATLESYQAALRLISYSNSSDNPSSDSRIVEFVASDGTSNSSPRNRTITVATLNDAPIVTPTAGIITYTEGDPAVAIDTTLALADIDSTTLASATVRIANYLNGEDQLRFTDQLGIVGNFDNPTGVLTLSGAAALTDYEIALRSVQYFNSSPNPTTTPRTVQFQVYDGGLNSNLGDRVVRVAPINAAPVVTTSGGTAIYTENGGGLAIDSGITVSDLDSSSLLGATVRISNNYVQGQDLLSFTSQFGITGSFDPATGTLTLSSAGTPTPANYQTVLRSVVYTNTSDNPDTALRTITVQVDDGFALSNLGSRTLSVTAVNDASIVSLANTPLSYTENGTAAAIGLGLTLSDLDNTTLDSATVRITNGVAGQDLLNFTLPAGIAGDFNASTSTLTLTGTAPLADYQTALRSVTYANTSENPGAVARSIAFQVFDGTDPSNAPVRTVALIPVNDAPVVTSALGNATYTENGAASVVDAGLTLTDIDSDRVTGATVRISNNFATGDSLSFSNALGITGSFNGTTGILTLSGTTTLANYETALRSVTYANSSDNPSPLDRTIQFQVSEDADLSNLAARTLRVTAVDDPPSLTVSPGTAVYTEAAQPIAIDSALIVTDIDDANLDSATITISNYVAGQDFLSFADPNGVLISSFNAGTLTLSGSATVAAYQTALRSVTYRNSSSNPDVTDRIIQIKVNDGELDSNQGTRTVRVIAANDVPTVTTSAGAAAYAENAIGAVIDGGLVLGDTDGTTLASAKVTIADYVAGQDLLSFTPVTGITGSLSGGVLTLSGSASLIDYQTVLRSVTYANSSDNPNPTSRIVQFQINDGFSDSTVANRSVTIAPSNDVPTLTIAAGSIRYVEGNPGLAIDPALLVTDPDSVNLASATVRISSNYVAGQDFLNFTSQFGITGSFDPATGTLTLTGGTTVANYRTALSSVTYSNSSETPSLLDRTIEFQVNDGIADSNRGNRIVQITDAPEAPIVTPSNGSLLYTENNGALAIDSSITLSDLDSTTLQTASIRITNYQSGQDLLSFTPTGGINISGSFDIATGTLTLAGAARLTDYETALRSITYTNTSNNPNLTTRTVEFTVNDGGLTSNPGSRSIQLAAINTPPVVTNSAGTTAYSENAPSVAIDSAIALSDVDSTTLASATVRITNFATEDQLTFIPLGNISGSVNAGVLTLSGQDTIANYQTVLRSVSYANSSNNPSSVNRTIEFQINDGAASSNVSSRQVGVIAVNDAPIVTASAGLVSYTENGTPSLIDTGLLIQDIDSADLVSAEVRITNFVSGQDQLTFTPLGNVSGSVNGGVLRLSGQDTIANYQAVLRSVAYGNSSTNPDLTNRSIAFTVTDQSQTSNAGIRVVQINSINSPPVLTASSGTTAYTEDGAAAAIDSGLTISDSDSPNLAGATVRIANFVAGQDQLNFIDRFNIRGDFNRNTGVLTLTGAGTLIDYQFALQSIAYSNSSNNPDITDRIVQFTVNDGIRESNIAEHRVAVIATNDAPVVTTSAGSAAFTENGAPIVLDPGLLLSDPDSATIARATVRISNFAAGEDQLNFTDQNGITGSFSNGILTLTGSASTPIAAFQTALRSVTYSNSSTAPNQTARTIQFRVNDGGLDSPIASRVLSITPINNAPILTAAAGSISYAENTPSVAIDASLTLSDADSPTIETATVRITNFVAGQDQLNFTDRGNIRGYFNGATGTLTLSGRDAVANYQTALRSITYSNSSDNPNLVDRTIQFAVNDGGLSSNTVTRTLQVTATNDLPIVNSSGSIDFTASTGAVLVDEGLVVSDADNPQLSGATVAIGGYVANQDLLSFTSQAVIKGSFNAAAGVLTLTGVDSIANYQTALRSIIYSNTSPTPDSGTRSIQFQVTDGAAASSVTTRSIQVTANNSPPILDLNGVDSGTGFSTTFVTGRPAVSITDTDLSLADPDSSTLRSAVVVITNPIDWTQEQLGAVTVGTNIIADYNPAAGRLTLIGTATRLTYQQVLRSVTYRNSALEPDPTTRTIVFTVDDGNFISNLATSTVNISIVRTVSGTPNNDPSLITTQENDVINALGSDDTVTSTLANLQQNDTIDGGAGVDTLVLTDGTGAAIVNAASAANQVSGITPATTAVFNFERFDFSRFSGTAQMTGSDRDNVLMGGAGQNTIDGGAGNDILKGNLSSDVVTGGAGNDAIDGGAGNDTLDGGADIDTLTGGSGDDLYLVDSSGDLAIEGFESGIDTVQAAVSFTLGANLENLTLTGDAVAGTGNALGNALIGNALNNILVGDLGNDSLIGNGGNDALSGDAGNDSLTGSSGQDRLVGGLGNDGFYILTARTADRDTIADFKSKDDTIFVAQSAFSQTLKLGKISRSQLKLGKAATDRDDRFIYNRGTGKLFFDTDGLGGAAQIHIATIANKSRLTRADIIVG